MLIKYYTLDGSLVIIDSICDVSSPSNPAFGEYASDNYKVYDFDTKDHGTHGSTPNGTPKIIEFANDGPCILKVFGTAYICNDDGKTIEKVSI